MPLGYLKGRIRRLCRGKEPQVYVISHPKCGRTWLRVLVGKALCDRYTLDPAHILDTLTLTRMSPILRTEFEHDGTATKHGTTAEQMVQEKEAYRGKKVILLVRDPRDTLVSFYFHALKRKQAFQGTISDFIRSEHFGIRRFVAFHNVWSRNQQVPREFTLIRYEQMHRDPQGALKGVLDVMGAQGVTSQILDAAVKFSRFENMKKMEEADHFKKIALAPADATDQESFKVRRGKVGGYTDYLNPEDCKYLAQEIQQGGCPFLTPYLQAE